MIRARLAKNAKERSICFRIRHRVFCKEQKISRTIEFDGKDTEAKHVLLFSNETPIGCARIRFPNNKAKLERIAILKRYRGKGYGKVIMEYMMAYCKRRGVHTIYFNSQYYLVSFYEQFGFKAQGRPFQEAGIKHIKMTLQE